ncbi:hypothetical protein BDZ91DRAFT_738135 [Kalaharituber pfeilii]|nr:hypothetical protein BDZ91DRAFT_738135 [Kalaharituber pfeilii]
MHFNNHHLHKHSNPITPITPARRKIYTYVTFPHFISLLPCSLVSGVCVSPTTWSIHFVSHLYTSQGKKQ